MAECRGLHCMLTHATGCACACISFELRVEQNGIVVHSGAYCVLIWYLMSFSMLNKVYVHYQGIGRSVHVLRDVNSELSVDDLCQLFVSSWNRDHIQSISTKGLQASTGKGRVLLPNQIIGKVIGKDADIYFTHNESDTTQRPYQNVDVPSYDHNIVPGVSQSPKCPARLDAPSEQRSLLDKPESPLIKPLLQKATEREASQHFKTAAFIYKQV